MLAGQYGPGARLAADAGIAPFVQAVIRHVIGADIFPHLGRAPVGERVKFNQRPVLAGKGRIALDHGHGRARAGALVLALACHPGREPAKLLPERHDLADRAALLMPVFIKTVKPLVTRQLPHALGIGRQNINIDRVMIADLLNKAVGLGVQAAGVQREHADIRLDPAGHINERHIFRAAE